MSKLYKNHYISILAFIQNAMKYILIIQNEIQFKTIDYPKNSGQYKYVMVISMEHQI